MLDLFITIIFKSIPFIGGIVLLLGAYGILPRNPKDPERHKIIIKKTGKFAKIIGFFLIIVGAFNIFISFYKLFK